MKRILLIALLAIFAVPVQAGDDWDWDRVHAPRKYAGKKYHKKNYRRPEIIRDYRNLDDDEDFDRDCKPPVRGVGTQWIGTEGALDAARKDWMERTRFDYGESWLDMANARGPYGSDNPVHSCGRTSVGEVAGQVMYRCTIIARPCKALMTEQAGKTK
jgi:hypothetical protein